MEVQSSTTDHRDRSRILAAIGVLLLLIGIAAAALGPLEMHCFYLFSEGGRFHYEGFGFGSFMFGNIACQIIGYYFIAILLIPLGYGHLKTSRWARVLSLTLLYSWLVLGVPLIVVFLFVLFSAKDLSPAIALGVTAFMALSYPLVPALLIRFYQSWNVRRTFETRDPGAYWLDQQPLPILVLSFLFLFYIVALHTLIFFRGIFPFFGLWLTGLEGILAIDISIMCLILLTWGMARLKVWAWWGSFLFFCLFTFSSLFTLSVSSLADLLSRMSFPPTEMEALQGLPLHGLHLAVLVGIPLLMTLGAIVLSKRHFRRGEPDVVMTSRQNALSDLREDMRNQKVSS